MKKFKMKKIQNPYLKGAAYLHKKQVRLGLALSLLFIFVCILSMLIDGSGAVGFGVSSAAFLTIGSIDDVTDRDTSGNDMAYKVWLVNVREQIDDSQAFPSPNASREVSTVPMKAGQYMRYFIAHTIPTLIGSGEKGDITTTGTNDLQIIMGGIRDKLLDFIEQYAGDKFIVIFKSISSSQYYIIGSYDRPMILKKYENKNDKDGRYITFNFGNDSITQYHKYSGSIVAAAAATHTANTTTIAIPSTTDVIDIPNNTAETAISAVSGLAAADKGRYITLIGSGTTTPATIADNSTFVMVDAATWTGKAGSRITFQVLDSATLVEVPGSRVQTA